MYNFCSKHFFKNGLSIMKYATCFLLILISSAVFSQEYKILLTEGKQWSTVDEYYHFLDGSANRSFQYYLTGDTSFNGTTYFTIGKFDDLNMTEESPGYIREDSLGHVYFRSLIHQECLIYDFSVEINDTVQFYYSQNPDNPIRAVVESIGVFEETGDDRRTITLIDIDVPSYFETWIEGIGSNRGFLESGFTFSRIVGAQYNLLCYHESDSLIYLNPRFTSCTTPQNVGTNSELAQKSIFSIYPNPISGRSIIKWSNSFQPERLNVYDLTGRTIYSKSIGNSNSSYIDRSDLEKGVLVLEIIDNEGKGFKQQIIVL